MLNTSAKYTELPDGTYQAIFHNHDTGAMLATRRRTMDDAIKARQEWEDSGCKTITAYPSMQAYRDRVPTSAEGDEGGFSEQNF